MLRLKTNHAIVAAQVSIYLYVMARFLVVFGAFAKYDVNPWVFLVIDAVTAAPYAVGWPKLVTSIVRRNITDAAAWGMVVAGSFAAPYVYIAISARNLPHELAFGVVTLVVCSVLLAAIKITRKFRQHIAT